jgi:exosome complex RNA-binding protein Rrp4
VILLNMLHVVSLNDFVVGKVIFINLEKWLVSALMQ